MSSRWPLVAVAAFVALVHLAWLMGGDTIVVDGNFFDGDSYARLVRVTQLYQGGGWFDSTIPRSNAPFGDTLHWTRPFDVILLAIALPLTPLLGFERALHLAGTYASPLLHVLTAVALAWAARPVLGRVAAYAAGALTASRFGVLGYATVGHADHHLLFALITVLAFGFFLRSLDDEDDRPWDAMMAGALIAVGIWVGTESLVFLALCLLISGLMWVADTPRAAARNLHLVLGLALALALALLVERGPGGYVDVEFDRISIVHLTLAALLLAFWGVAGSWKGSAVLRLAAGAAGAAAIVAVLWLLFPDILHGPMADVDPVLIPYFDSIAEYSPIKDFPHFLAYMGGILLALPWAAWRIREEWPGAGRWKWLLIVVSMVVFTTFAVNWVRWSMYAGIFIIVVVCDLVLRVDAAISARLSGVKRILVKVSTVLFLIIGPSVIGIAFIAATDAKNDEESVKCDVRKVAEYLNSPRWADRPRTLVTSANFGNELLYRTKHRVVSTLQHRNAGGILNVINILGGADDGEILRLVRKRRIDLIVMCPDTGSFRHYTEHKDDNILFKRLERSQPPGWLREAHVPPELRQIFRLFEVVGTP